MYIEKRESQDNVTTPSDWASNLKHAFALSSTALALFDFHRKVFDPIWLEIRKRVKKGDILLDAGCGMGQWVRFLSNNGICAVGCDYSVEMISLLARAYPRLPWVLGLIQHIPVRSHYFDHVVSWGVIEHDPDGPQQALREFNRVLKAGGYVFVTTPIDTPMMRRSSATTFEQTNNNATFFQYFFTPDELADFVKQAGFEVQTVVPCGRSYAVTFPRLYKAVVQRGRLANTIVGKFLLPFLGTDASGMVLVVGRKL